MVRYAVTFDWQIRGLCIPASHCECDPQAVLRVLSEIWAKATNSTPMEMNARLGLDGHSLIRNHEQVSICASS